MLLNFKWKMISDWEAEDLQAVPIMYCSFLNLEGETFDYIVCTPIKQVIEIKLDHIITPGIVI